VRLLEFPSNKHFIRTSGTREHQIFIEWSLEGSCSRRRQCLKRGQQGTAYHQNTGMCTSTGFAHTLRLVTDHQLRRRGWQAIWAGQVETPLAPTSPRARGRRLSELSEADTYAGSGHISRSGHIYNERACRSKERQRRKVQSV
jgi:hypothetical protein